MPRLIQKIGKKVHLVNVKHARTLGQRFMGLMGKSRDSFDYALVFHLAEKGKLNASIHMMFMRFPIDVLFLDEKQRVVDCVESLSPWTLNYTPKKDAQFVVELPIQTIRKYNITNGVPITWNK